MIQRLLAAAPEALTRAARRVASDSTAVANAGQSVLKQARHRQDRERLAPGARSDGPGHVLEAIEPERCWELLATQPLGRLSFTAHSGVPVIVPVNFAVDDRTIVLRSGHGPKLTAAARRDLVAFEVDDIDIGSRTGWSVVVIGQASLVTESSQRRRLDALGLQPWASGPREDYVVITPRNVAGRRLRAAEPRP